MAHRDTLLQILDLARWAPSGDNTQPWRFEIAGDDRLVVHGHDTRTWCLYDYNGHASHMAHGALLETLRIAATAHGLESVWRLRADSTDTAPVYDVTLSPVSGLAADPLLSCIERRTVQRRAMRATPLDSGQRTALAAGVRGDLPEGQRGKLFAGHSLRSGLASSAEVDERFVQKQLGHASAEMTRKYQRRRDRFRVNLTKASGL